MDSFDDDGSSNLRQRLWGAAVFVAIMVIVLPLLLDGAGSESQFRRVERLRQEPPSIIDSNGNIITQQIPEMRALGAGNVAALKADRPFLDIKIGEDDPPDYMKEGRALKETLMQNRTTAQLTAWVVQAGSFRDETNALAVRDRLRRAGFASFVREKEPDTAFYKVLVGPMISEQSASAALHEVETLLGMQALVHSYP